MDDHPHLSDIDALGAEIPIDDLLRVFSHPPARHAALTLLDAGEMDLDELADVVTGWLYSRSEHVATRSDRDDVKTGLYHVYLPLLETTGVVRFDADEQRIEAVDHAAAMDTFIEWARTLDQQGVMDDVG